jgi:phenylacetate-CoA ligase
VPLVRYNIHDRGGVKSFEEIMKIVKKCGYNIKKELKKYGYTMDDVWHLPFFYVFGRSDGTISVGGALIYPENVDVALYTPRTAMINSYKLTTIFDKKMNVRPAILVELDKNYKYMTKEEIKDLKNKLHDVFMKTVIEMNGDFRDAYRVDPKCLDLIIKVYPYNLGPFIEDKKKIKRKYILQKI